MDDITTEFIPDDPIEEHPIRSNIINDHDFHVKGPRGTESIENNSQVNTRLELFSMPVLKYLRPFPHRIFFESLRAFSD